MSLQSEAQRGEKVFKYDTSWTEVLFLAIFARRVEKKIKQISRISIRQSDIADIVSLEHKL